VEAIFESRKIELLPQVKEKILELVGIPIPYFLQVLLTAISERSRTQGGTVSTELVGAAFEEDLLGGMTSAVFQHYRARLDQYYLGSEGHAAKAILATLSRADSPVQRDTLYQIWLRVGNVQPTPQSREDFLQLMQKLDNDFYVVEENEGYTFFSRVLKLWWKRYYGFQEG
jgi:hypothetical protein